MPKIMTFSPVTTLFFTMMIGGVAAPIDRGALALLGSLGLIYLFMSLVFRWRQSGGLFWVGLLSLIHI